MRYLCVPRPPAVEFWGRCLGFLNTTTQMLLWCSSERAVMSCSRCGVMTFHTVCASLSVAAGHGV